MVIDVSTPASPLIAGNIYDGNGSSIAVSNGFAHVAAWHEMKVIRLFGSMWRYIPDPGFTGSDSFTFAAFNGTDTSSPATVEVLVEPLL